MHCALSTCERRAVVAELLMSPAGDCEVNSIAPQRVVAIENFIGSFLKAPLSLSVSYRQF